MKSSIRIIHNCRISMTDEEFRIYTLICRSYDRENFKGDDLFRDLFETDQKGNITIIRPPSKTTSMEVFLFVCALYQQQGRRLMEEENQSFLQSWNSKFEEKMKELNDKS